MKKMLKKYLGITQLEQGLSQRIRGVEVNVKELTQMHIDVDLRGKSTVILCGRYRRQDYVRVFNVQESDITGLISHLSSLDVKARCSTVAAHPLISEHIKGEL